MMKTLMQKGITTSNNLFICDRSAENELFELMYLDCRRKEHRVYQDDEVRNLPNINELHPHHGEWQLRKKSATKLIRFLEGKQKNLNILEIGCGNGWLCQQLSCMPGAKVVGVDINLVELQQASRVFSGNPRLKFIYGDIRKGVLDDLSFDIIVFAASIQYFNSLQAILDEAWQRLSFNGEIHIIDSHFYKKSEMEKAIVRTKNYYKELGNPGMSEYYFHHYMDELKLFSYEMKYNPGTLFNKITHNNPFPWIRITKKYNARS